MKARKKDSNDEWKDVIYVQLEDSDILFKEQYLEFQHDESPTELKTNDQVEEEKHWQDVRERAAIAALNGTITILSNSDRYVFRDVVVEGFSGNEKTYPNAIAEFAIACANALVKQLKGECYGSNR